MKLLSASLSLFFVVSSFFLQAQTLSGYGSLQGKVQRDETDEPVRANIILERDGQFVAVQGTNAHGLFLYDQLAPGNYDVSVALKGEELQDATIPEVSIEEGKLTTLNIGIAANGQVSSEVIIEDDPRSSPKVTRIIREKEEEVPEEEQKPVETYTYAPENDFIEVADAPLSSFAAKVDHAFYTIIRRMIRNHHIPPAGAVRIEEMINYFSYHYPAPEGEEVFSVTTETGRCPWNKEHEILMVGIRGRDIISDELPPSNLVFLVDVSSSMATRDKLPLLRSSLRLLVDELRPKDRVAIVTYANTAEVHLTPTRADQKVAIKKAIATLKPGGSTAGESGLRLAYKLAEESFLQDGNNRIIVGTDGDFNIGLHTDDAIKELISDKRKMGIYLTVLGYGSGNYKDSKMEIMADHGNGNYYYVDNLEAARKVLSDELGGTLYAIARDVKIQLQFDERITTAYRLLGYSNHLLSEKAFRKKKTDAGEIGAGHRVTALYELIPHPEAEGVAAHNMQVNIRYKEVPTDKHRKMSHPIQQIASIKEGPSADFRMASAVAAFGMLLKSSKYSGEADFKQVIELAESTLEDDQRGYRADFIRMVKEYIDLARREGLMN